jgi:sigma54-dependent transcription regulator
VGARIVQENNPWLYKMMLDSMMKKEICTVNSTFVGSLANLKLHAPQEYQKAYAEMYNFTKAYILLGGETNII